jgi:hypothetical protein
MSGPYCESCKYFVREAIGSAQAFRECDDPAKIIYDRNGNRVTESPQVHEKYTCSRHAPAELAFPDGERE